MKIRISKNGLEKIKNMYESIGKILTEYSDEFELTDENFIKVKKAIKEISGIQTKFVLNTLIEVIGPDNETMYFI